jgi:hypothetical protein
LRQENMPWQEDRKKYCEACRGKIGAGSHYEIPP